ncbi:MAG: hypothetical protein Athens071426_61 [Parcubacteria group bacterium Athens0714_26]|nr:MAG: hypothetical protein Athens101426_245 [Parcubacteria group bacterium Athens1014_26]TSD03728.1 MAG: hypothetical protein Athens071426_61 [Parcubacteria group bacterium Athens0714_26]
MIKKVLPSVVSIVVSKKLEEVEKELPAELFSLLPFSVPDLKNNGQKIDSRGMVQIDGGSGFIVDPAGIILTNKHVVSDVSAEYTIITSDNKKYLAEIIACDPIDDVAILKIKSTDKQKLPFVKLGDSSKLELGQTVLAIGNVLGIFQNTVSKGIVSGLSRAINAQTDSGTPAQELRGLIQTDAAINPGNSGGPLINENGEVIAINAAIVSGAQNIGFAIPINAAKRDLSDVKKYGKVKRPLLGLRYINIDAELQRKLDLPSDYGALVAGKGEPLQGIILGTPAAKAGFEEGDVITECNGEKLSECKTIQDFLEKLNVGDTLKMKVLRKEKELEIKVVLGERK